MQQQFWLTLRPRKHILGINVVLTFGFKTCLRGKFHIPLSHVVKSTFLVGFREENNFSRTRGEPGPWSAALNTVTGVDRVKDGGFRISQSRGGWICHEFKSKSKQKAPPFLNYVLFPTWTCETAPMDVWNMPSRASDLLVRLLHLNCNRD